jgi:hypothetical protein
MTAMLLILLFVMVNGQSPGTTQQPDQQYNSLDTSFAVVFVVVFMAGLFGCIAYTLYNVNFHPVGFKHFTTTQGI